MPLGKATPQMTEQLELALFAAGETREQEGSGEAKLAGNGNTDPGMMCTSRPGSGLPCCITAFTSC